VLKYDFDQSVGYWLMLATQSIRRVLEARLVDKEITLRQWEVLAWLACDPNLSQSQLAQSMGIEPPTLAGVVNRMARDGWIEKANCEDDRRRCRLSPTPQVEEIWNGSLSVAHEVRSQAIAGISDDELQVLKRVCFRIRDNLSQIGTLEPVEPCDSIDEEAVQREMKVLKSM
jgi:DNA-binding MarR family transcriptional regulator